MVDIAVATMLLLQLVIAISSIVTAIAHWRVISDELPRLSSASVLPVEVPPAGDSRGE